MRQSAAAAIERRGNRFILVGVLMVPVAIVVVTWLIFEVLTRSGAPVWILGIGCAVGGVIALAVGVVLVRALRRRVADRVQAELRAEAAVWARERQWSVASGSVGASGDVVGAKGDAVGVSGEVGDVARETGDRFGADVPYPEHLRAPAVEPERCVQLLRGTWDGWQVRVESWQTRVREREEPWSLRQPQQLIRLRSSDDLPALALFDERSSRWMSRFVPRGLTEQPLTRMGELAYVGDQQAESLAPWLAGLTAAFRATGALVVLAPGEVAGLFPSDADAQVLEYRLGLLTAVADTAQSWVSSTTEP